MGDQKGSAPTFLILSIVVFVGVAVGGYLLFQKPSTPVTSPIPTFSPMPRPSITPSPTNQDTTLPSPVQLAKQDLAEKLKVDQSQIKVVKQERVEWRNSSLGCPKEGYFYAQVITPGYRVVIDYNQQQYEYHTDLNKNFVQCSQK